MEGAGPREPRPWPPRAGDPSRCELRLCAMADLEDLRAMGRRTYEETFGAMNDPATMAAYLAEAFAAERFHAELATTASAFYFAETGGERAGYLKLNEPPAQSDLNEPGTVELERIYVERAHQGRGLGRAMLREAERIAAGRGARVLWLGVWERNREAIRFYEKNGFAEAGRHPFRMGDEVQSDLVMRKAIGAATGPAAQAGEEARRGAPGRPAGS